MNKYQQDRASTPEEIGTSKEVRPLTSEELDAVVGGATYSWFVPYDPAQMIQQMQQQQQADTST